MNRRKFLGLAGSAGLASTSGCIGTVRNVVNASRGQRVITDIKSDSQPPEFDIEHNVRIEKAESDENSPPKIVVEISNTGESARRIRGPSDDAFSSKRSQDEELAIVTPKIWDMSMIDSNRCWELSDSVVIQSPTAQMKLHSGETVRNEYDVLSSSNKNTCMSPGEYRFTTEFEILVGPRNSSRLQGIYSWGFDMTIEEV